MDRQRSVRAAARCIRIGDARCPTPRRLLTWVANLWLRYLAWQTRRALLLLLQNLDDRTLKDIGLDRDEVGVGVGIAFDRWAAERVVGQGPKPLPGGALRSEGDAAAWHEMDYRNREHRLRGSETWRT